MICLEKAINQFEKYVSGYDMKDPSIHLKYIHTYKTMECTTYLCNHLNMEENDKQLALLIALLHDIGRFEQWKVYKSFADYKTVDHALFSSQLLFQEGLIREFIDDPQYDDIIRNSIEQHNKYKVDKGFDDKTLKYIHIIRDADKLDNFRVKDEEKIEDLLYETLDNINKETISLEIYIQMYNQELVYAPYRKTHLDMWLSYIAFIYDLYFDVSKQYIIEYDWVNRSFDRLDPQDEETKKQYNTLKKRMQEYLIDK